MSVFSCIALDFNIELCITRERDRPESRTRQLRVCKYLSPALNYNVDFFMVYLLGESLVLLVGVFGRVRVIGIGNILHRLFWYFHAYRTAGMFL